MPQEMVLEFADGIVRGDGRDDLGTFAIEGEYRVGDDVRVGWIKTYDQAHSVLYRGVLRDDALEGRWQIDAYFSGGFALRFDASSRGPEKGSRP